MGQLLNNPHRSELQHYSVRHTNYLIADVQHQGRSVFMLLHFTRIPAKTNKNESNQKAENTFPFFLSSCSWMCGEMVNKTLWSHEWSLCSRNHNMAFFGRGFAGKSKPVAARRALQTHKKQACAKELQKREYLQQKTEKLDLFGCPEAGRGGGTKAQVRGSETDTQRKMEDDGG